MCYSSIITCLQFVLGPNYGQRREKKETHTHTGTHTWTRRRLRAGDYGCSYSSSHCGSTTGRVWGGKQACTAQHEEWTRSVEGQVPCGRGCARTQMGTPGNNVGERARSQGPRVRTCAVNAAAEEDAAPVQSRYRRSAETQGESSTQLPARQGEGSLSLQPSPRRHYHIAITTAFTAEREGRRN